MKKLGSGGQYANWPLLDILTIYLELSNGQGNACRNSKLPSSCYAKWLTTEAYILYEEDSLPAVLGEIHHRYTRYINYSEGRSVA